MWETSFYQKKHNNSWCSSLLELWFNLSYLQFMLYELQEDWAPLSYQTGIILPTVPGSQVQESWIMIPVSACWATSIPRRCKTLTNSSKLKFPSWLKSNNWNTISTTLSVRDTPHTWNCTHHSINNITINNLDLICCYGNQRNKQRSASYMRSSKLEIFSC